MSSRAVGLETSSTITASCGIHCPRNSRFASWLDDPRAVKIPGGTESVISAQQRILKAVRDIAKTSGKESVLVVTHKHIGSLLMCALCNVPLNQFQQMIDESVVPRILLQEIVTYLCVNSTED